MDRLLKVQSVASRTLSRVPDGLSIPPTEHISSTVYKRRLLHGRWSPVVRDRKIVNRDNKSPEGTRFSKNNTKKRGATHGTNIHGMNAANSSHYECPAKWWKIPFWIFIIENQPTQNIHIRGERLEYCSSFLWPARANQKYLYMYVRNHLFGNVNFPNELIMVAQLHAGQKHVHINVFRTRVCAT